MTTFALFAETFYRSKLVNSRHVAPDLQMNNSGTN